jgi:PAS domain S-box-containing protein
MADDQNHRLNTLRQQAAQILAQGGTSLDTSQIDTADLARLTEELCIYHEELKIQNEELSISHTRLESARAHYEGLFKLMPLPVMLMDVHGTIMEGNTAAEDWLGPVRRFHHYDIRLTNSLHRNDRPRLLRFLSSLEEGQNGQLCDLYLSRFDQSERQVDLHITLLPKDFHQEARFIVALLDRSIEAARLAEQGLFNALLDSSDDLIFATDMHGRLMLANEGFLGVVGVRRDRALGRKLSDFWPQDQVSRLQAQETEVIGSGHKIEVVERLRWRMDKAERPWVIRKFPIRGPKGGVVGVASVCRDLGAQEAAPGSHTDLLAQAFMALPVPSAITCAQGKTLRMNAALQTLCGLSEQALAGRQVLPALLEPSPTLPAWATVHEACLERGRWEGMASMRHSSGYPTQVVDLCVARFQPAPETESMLLWTFSPRL